MLSQMYTAAVATLAGIYLTNPCIASSHPVVWRFDGGGVYGLNDMIRVYIDISDSVWTIEQSGLTNMEGIDELSEFLFFAHYSSGSSVQCVVSHKFDTQSSYRVASTEAINHTFPNSVEIGIPIDHNATSLYIKLETQGLPANDSEGCIWSGKLSNFRQDGQCEDDGDECIYIIGMDDGNATDYVQEWHQQGCFDTYPAYVREYESVNMDVLAPTLVNQSNGSEYEYLCNNEHWYATDQNCAEFEPYPSGHGGGPLSEHALGSCWSTADIFGCSGDQGHYTMNFTSNGDRYATKLITKCSEIDLSPVESEYNSSICLQLEWTMDDWDQLSMYRLSTSYVVDSPNYRYLRYGTFSMSDDYSRSGEPLYWLKGKYDWMYYVHNDGNRWIISMETLTMDGIERGIPRSELALFCDEDDLMDCTQNKWMQNGTVFDRIKVVAGECPAGGLRWEEITKAEKKKWVLPLIICGGIGGVMLLVLGIYCWRKQSKTDHAAINGVDESVEIKVGH